MKLDRELQLKILQDLLDIYPSGTNKIRQQFPEVDSSVMLANLYYLDEHGLISSGIQRTAFLSGEFAFTSGGIAVITARGADFLADDGGISAILGTTTIKLHADSIKQLLIDKIEQSNKTPAEKSLLRKNIETMSGEATKTATKYLMDQGLAHLPDVAQWLQTLFRP